MAKKYHFEEMAIYKFIVDEFNNNSSNGKIKFSVGHYFLDENNETLFSKRFTELNGRFDVKKTMDDDTYELKDESFVPMSIPSLNANYLAHDVIKDVTYEPEIEFLVYAENVITFHSIEMVLQEVRARFIQYQTVLDVSYMNIDNTSGARITETLKVVGMSGELRYGNIVRVAGKAYLSMSLSLVLEVTNHGEYANQERIYLSVPSVNSGAYVEVHPIAWNWGTGIDTEGSQLLNDKNIANVSRAKYIRHIPKSTAFAYGMALQIDFRNAILKKIYKDSRQPNQTNSKELWKIKSEVYVLNETTKVYEKDTDLTLEDTFLLDNKSLVGELSKGEKVVFSLSFVPSWIAS